LVSLWTYIGILCSFYGDGVGEMMKHIERIWWQFLARFTRLEKLEDIAGNYAEISAIYQNEFNRRKAFIELTTGEKRVK